MKIPFKETYYDERENACVTDALKGTDYISKVKTLLTDTFAQKHLFLTTSGSSAFDLLFCALNPKAGMEVIMPSFTFPSAANTVLRAGLRPVFADIDIDNKALDVSDVAGKLTDRTCCVITTHYGGSSVDMSALRGALKDILMIEDAALSYGASYKGKPLGTIGGMGILSFHRTKNVSADEGGLLLLNACDEALVKAAQTVYDNGTDKDDFLQGLVSGYTWQRAGMNCEMANLNAALLYAQLQKNDEIMKAQRKIYEYYMEQLTELSSQYGFELPYIPDYNTNNYHVFYLLFESAKLRERVRLLLKESGIAAYFHYMPLHLSNMGKSLGYQRGDLPVTEQVCERILRLPIYAALGMDGCKNVVDAIREALCRR